MEVPGGTSGNIQSWACTISLHGYSTSRGTSHWGPVEEEEEEEEHSDKLNISEHLGT
jgi:hypothetical protein